ncbi:cell division protein ZapE [Peristeroidobacter soli]|uniref:cell division protein ZapE n=1 Tax=Peristeroidobacter soli TaxID=2497877 RepID=UPI00101BF262|nr:cell division protein ZapE [Peristeroidobacter soli]
MDEHIPLQFRINYPRKPRAGVRYLISVDVDCDLRSGQWPYAEEEYPVTCFLDAGPAFVQESAGDSTIVVHRFGGSYGPAKFWVTAREPGPANIRYVLVNRAGVPIVSRSAAVDVVEQARPQVVVDAGRDLVESISRPVPQPAARPASARVFRWLHLGDLHYRVRDGWSAQPLIDDVCRHLSADRPIDAVIVTGDLTMHAGEEQFVGVGDLLFELRSSIQKLQQAWPALIVVPGNHDGEHRIPFDRDGLGARIADGQERTADFWSNEQDPQRQSVARAFYNYESWRRRAESLGGNVRGLLPGDFAISREINGIRVGIVGLNDSSMSPFRTFGGNSASLDRKQLDAVCGDVAEWASRHELRILLTHHAPPQFSPQTRQHFLTDFAPRWLFDVRLYASWQGKDPVIDDGHEYAIGCNAAPKSEAWDSGVRAYRIGEAILDAEEITVRVQGRQLRRAGWTPDVSDRTDSDGVRSAHLGARPALPVALPVSTAPVRKRHALLAGVGEVASQELPRLHSAASDAYALTIELSRLGYASTQLLSDTSATSSNILKTLDELYASSDPDDLMLLFFAGHAIARDGTTVLAAHDWSAAGGGVVLENILGSARKAGRRLLVLTNVGPVSVRSVPAGTGVIANWAPAVKSDRGLPLPLAGILLKATTPPVSVSEFARVVEDAGDSSAFVKLSSEIEPLILAEAERKPASGDRAQQLLERFRKTHSPTMLARAGLLAVERRAPSRVDPALWNALAEGGLVVDSPDRGWDFVVGVQQLLQSVADRELFVGMTLLWVGNPDHELRDSLSDLIDRGAKIYFASDTNKAAPELRKRDINIVVVERPDGHIDESLYRAAELIREGWRLPVLLFSARFFSENVQARISAMNYGMFACASDWSELFEWICEAAGRTISAPLTADQRFLLARVRGAGVRARDGLIEDPEFIAQGLLRVTENRELAFDEYLRVMRAVAEASACQIIQLVDEQPVVIASRSRQRQSAIGPGSRRALLEKVSRAGEPMWIPDLAVMSPAVRIEETSRSMLLVPVRDIRALGVVQLELPETDALNETTRAWLARFCAPLAECIRELTAEESAEKKDLEAGSSEATVTALYEAECVRWGYTPDAAQLAVAEELEQLRLRLVTPAPKRRLINFLRSEPRRAERGLYIWGGAGMGKTLLLDLFIRSLTIEAKQHEQFHRFMRSIHDELRFTAKGTTPLRDIAQSIARRAQVLCLDDLFVTDIADAMILGGLLKELGDAGVTLVIGSRVRARELYKNGLQRQRFLPAIELLQERTVELELRGEVDHRSQLLVWTAKWLDAADQETQGRLETLFDALTRGQGQSNATVTIHGAPLLARWLNNDAVWFAFDEICGERPSLGDYDELGHRFRTVFVSDVPQFGVEHEVQAHRFALLVDSIYECGGHLVVSARAPIDTLYQGSRYKGLFGRTAQRLTEMQTELYSSRDPSA